MFHVRLFLLDIDQRMMLFESRMSEKKVNLEHVFKKLKIINQNMERKMVER
jgi:hypothetical protein